MRAIRASGSSVRSDDADAAPTVIDGLTSIVVVAADSGPLLQTCIASALASDGDVEVILVDNASVDGEIDRVESRHRGDQRLHVLLNDSNLGFGPACNRGAAIARGDVLMFLNPDCDVPPALVAGVRQSLAADATIGLLGITLCDALGQPARGNRRRDPTLARALSTLSGLWRWEYRWPALAGIEMPLREETDGVAHVEAVSGACMCLPRGVFERVRGFDPEYFLHVEDLDLCRRVRDTGYGVVIASALRAVHRQGSSSRRRPIFVDYFKHRGMWRYFTKFDPAARFMPVRMIVWAGLWLHFLARAPFRAMETPTHNGVTVP